MMDERNMWMKDMNVDMNVDEGNECEEI